MIKGLSYLSTLTSSTVPIRRRRQKKENLPTIENIVTTVDIIPQTPDKRFSLPLDAIATSLQCSQYAPVSFAACIIKFTDSITESTALIFRTGKVVVVASLTMDHAFAVSQMVRFIVEQVRAVFLGPPVRFDSLVGHTIVSNFSTHNMVGKGQLGMEIDLQYMADTNPMCCKYAPKSFPGLKSKIWLTPTHQCTCKRQHKVDEELLVVVGKQSKCVCSVKVLFFKKGNIVITGARSPEDINSVFLRVKQTAESGGFYKNVASLMVMSNDVESKPLLRISMGLDNVLGNMTNSMFINADDDNTPIDKTLTPFLRMVDDGRVDDVRLMLQYDKTVVQDVDSKGRTVLERLPADLSDAQKQIVDLIKIYGS